MAQSDPSVAAFIVAARAYCTEGQALQNYRYSRKCECALVPQRDRWQQERGICHCKNIIY